MSEVFAVNSNISQCGILKNKRGRVVIENGEHVGRQGDGQFLKRGTCVNI